MNEKGLASGKRHLAFFLREGFEATVSQIPHLVIELVVEPVETRYLRTHAPIQIALKIQGRCTMEIVRADA